MPATFVQGVGSAVNPSSGTFATLAISVGATVAAGNALILFGRSGGSFTISSVADTQSNTWHVDSTVSNGGLRVNIVSCAVSAGLGTADTITATYSGGGNTQCAGVAEFAGLLTSGGRTVTDQTASGTSGGTSVTCATSTATAQAAELVICSVGQGGTTGETFTLTATDPDSGGTWHNLTLPPAGSARSDGAYQIPSATSKFSCTWTTTDTSDPLGAGIVTYKAVPGGLLLSCFP